ncbi:hypothetical protein [Rhodococcus aetherivorans]|uniref:hypothetical protein n=1 Tax=Rhodococcus aetherivorans TaxID=191292 RepID=UPI00388E7450
MSQPQDTGAVPTISDIVYKLHVKAFLDGKVPNMDYPEEAVSQLESLMQQRELAAQIKALKNLPGYKQKNGYRVEYEDILGRIAELERQQTEVMNGGEK